MPSVGLESVHDTGTSSRLPWVVGVVTGVTVVGCVAGPRAAAGFVLLFAGVAALINLRAHGFGAHAFKVTQITALLLALCAYVFVNVSWSLIPQAAFAKASILLAVVLVSQFAVFWVLRQDGEVLSALGRGLLIGYGLAALFIAFEILTEQAATRLLLNTFEFLRPDSQKHHRITNGEVSLIGSYDRNRSVAVLNLLFWSTVGVWSVLAQPRWRWPILGLAGACLAIATFGSVHEASKVALLAGLVVFAICRLSLPLARVLVGAAWIVACLFAVPIASGLYGAELHKAEWLPRSARSRVIVWGVTAERTWRNPIFGVGVNSTREIDRRAKEAAGGTLDHLGTPRTGRHAHNVFVQTWFELGAVGALLLLAVGLAMLRALARTHESVQPVCFASFAVAMGIATFSWGMWQTWFQAAFAVTAIMLSIAVRLSQNSGSSGQSVEVA